MASKSFFDTQSTAREVKTVAGSFAPAGTGAPTDVKGKGFTVARTSAGLFTITFSDRYPHLLAVEHGIQLAAAAPNWTQVGAYDAAAKTLQIRVIIAAGTVADVAAATNNRIHFVAHFSNTGTP